MSQYKSILVYGFALFAMFFGSGNLVFPIKIGQLTGEYWLLGFAGLFVTGIILPFLGLFVIKLYKGDYTKFFGEAGSFAKVALPLFTLSLLGSFGVVPRCITVAFGGMEYLTPELPLSIFSALFCIVTYYFGLKDESMVNSLGKWMCPILLVALVALIAVGIFSSSSLESSAEINPNKAFKDGFLIGYQTMDLFAAFFFSALTFAQIQKIMPKNATHMDVVKFAVKPSILGAFLLSIIYLGFVYLGAHYADVTAKVDPEYMLPSIAKHIMGDSAALFIAVAMLFSCLTTAVALNNIYARYLCNLFKLKNDKFPIVLAITTFIAFTLSLLDFKGIAAFLAPCLEVSYPGIIALTILSIITAKHQKLKMIVFYGVTIFMIVNVW